MSIRYLNAVWNDPEIKGRSDLVVMLAIADHANDKGAAWPGIERLAMMTRHSERGIQKVLKRLADTGKIKIKRGGLGQGHTNTYQILITPNAVRPSRVNGSAKKGERECIYPERGVPAGSPDPPGTTIPNHQGTSPPGRGVLSGSERISLEKERERIKERRREIREQAVHDAWGPQYNFLEKDERKRLKERDNELKALLGSMV